MSGEKPSLDAVFAAAIAIESEQERNTYLGKVCAGEPSFRRQIERLLNAHFSTDSLLDSSPIANQATDIRPITEQPGDTIGPYKLLQQIGEGGMGTVFMAEQTEPVERRVALKIIKPGMDTQQVIARFEAERQALAMMDHPNIAKVLDAGTTESGRPYFVMELVKGVPITDYCDEQHLTPRERLELFIPICQAVQHAHQKGIIHRDLKPTNILVAQYDNKPVPKVIDFGVAKAISHKLTEKTMFTQYGQIVGTVEYMSPEQARFNQLDVDTRSDVYSLGVLLYELLTGETPFDKNRLRSAAFDELLRILREEEPPKPSLKLSSSQSLPSIAANRHIEPNKLSTLVRGELDWIVMKALEKDRGRRYETPSAFAEDIRHYLNNEAVLACPPSALYRFHKFARRNKGALAVTSAALLVLIAFAVGSTITASQFRRLYSQKAELVVEKDEALQQAIAAETAARESQKLAESARDQEAKIRIEAQLQTKIAEEALADAKRQRVRAEANYDLARSAVDEFLNQVTENELLTVPGMQSLREQLLTEALEFYDTFAQDKSNDEELQLELARTYYRIGTIRAELAENEAAKAAYQKSQQLFEHIQAEGNSSPQVSIGLAKVYFKVRQYSRVIELCESIRQADPEHVESRRLMGDTYNALANKKADQSKIGPALEYHEKALELREGLVRDFPEEADYLALLGSTMNNIGVLLAKQRYQSGAVQMFQLAANYQELAYERSPQNILWGRWLCTSLSNFARKQRHLGENENALAAFQRVVAVRRKLVVENQRIPTLRGELADALRELGNYQRALKLTEQADRSHRATTELLEAIPHATPEEKVELALVYGTLSTPPRHSIKQPDQQERAERKYYEEKAWETIQSAIDDGYRNLKILQSHESLAVLRQRDDFQHLVARLKVQEGEVDKQLTGESREHETQEQERQMAGENANSLKHQKSLAKLKYSIGVVQTTLNKFEDAEESLRQSIMIHKQLKESSDAEVDVALSLLDSQAALGRVFWKTGRLPEAHRHWNEVMSKLDLIARRHREDSETLAKIALIELRICEYYARLGIWELAAEYPLRNLRFNRYIRISWDSRFAPFVLLTESPESYRTYCVCYNDFVQNSLTGSGQEATWLTYLLWTCNLVEEPGVPTELLFDTAQRAAELKPDHLWVRFCRATLLYRNGKLDEALEVLPVFDDGIFKFSGNYLRSLILFRLGQHESAAKLLARIEDEYIEFCRLSLKTIHPPGFAAPFGNWRPDYPNWWEFTYSLPFRKEARQIILNDSISPEPWQDLIQARGYRLIGEFEKAQQHITAAIEAGGEDPAFRITLAELFERWGEVAKANALIFGDDKYETLSSDEISRRSDETLVSDFYDLRARLFARQSRFKEAAADYLQVVDQFPNQTAWHSQRSRYLLKLAQQEQVYEALMRLRPDDIHLKIVLGRHLGLCDRWTEAADAFLSVTDNSPIGHEVCFEIGCLLRLTDDVRGYRQHLEVISPKARRSEQPDAPFVLVRTLSLMEQSAETAEQMVRWSRLAVEKRSTPWRRHVLGISLYRAGRYEAAIESLGNPTPGNWKNGHAQNWLLLALSHYELGHHETAHQYLQKADRWLASARAKAENGPVDEQSIDWFAVNALRHDAEQILKVYRLAEPLVAPRPKTQGESKRVLVADPAE